MGVYVQASGVNGLGESWWRKAKRYGGYAINPAGAAAKAVAKTVVKRAIADERKNAARAAANAEITEKMRADELRRLPADKRGGLFFKALGDRLTSKRSPAHIWITTLPFHDTMAGDILAYGKKLSKAERRKLLSILHDVAAKLDDKKKPRARDEMLLIWRFVESIWSRI